MNGSQRGSLTKNIRSLFVNWMRPRTLRCSDLEARHPLLQVGCSNRLDINEARALIAKQGCAGFAEAGAAPKCRATDVRRDPWSDKARTASFIDDPRMTCSALSFCSGHIETVTLRFSPRFGFSPVSCALTNSNAATALLDGPSHSSAVSG